MPPPQKKEEQKSEESLRVLLEPQVSHDHFPVLEIIFERLCHSLSVTLHGLTSVNVEVTFEEAQTVHFGNYLESAKAPSMFGIFHAEEWDNDALIVFNSLLVRPFLELMLGGQLTAETKKKGSPEENAFTQIERHLIDKLFQNCLDTLSAQISPITPIRLSLSHTETSTRGLAIVRETSPCIVGYFKIHLEALVSEFQIVFPYTTIQPVRSILADAFMGEKMGNDSLWVDHIHHELPETHLLLDAVLGDVWIPIRDIIQWKKGSSFHLTVTPDSQIQLKCLGTPLLTAKMGQKKGMLALSVEEVLLKKNPPGTTFLSPPDRAQEPLYEPPIPPAE